MSDLNVPAANPSAEVGNARDDLHQLMHRVRGLYERYVDLDRAFHLGSRLRTRS